MPRINSISAAYHLGEQETLATFHEWRSNLENHLSQETEFTDFLDNSFTWKSTTESVKHRGLKSIDKAFQLRRFLAVIANLCPPDLQTGIVNDSTCLKHIYRLILSYYQLTPSETTFIAFAAIRRETVDGVMEKPEQLLLRMREFIADNLLLASGTLTYQGKPAVTDELMSPTTERLLVLRWLELLHPALPSLVSREFHEELRNKTLVDLQHKMLDQMDRLLLKCDSEFRLKNLGNQDDQKMENSVIIDDSSSISKTNHEDSNKVIGTSNIQIAKNALGKNEYTCSEENLEEPPALQRVSVLESPQYKVKINNVVVNMILDTGCTGSLISSDICELANVEIASSKHSAVQADGDSHLKVVGEVHVDILMDDYLLLPVDALVVSKLKAGFIVGMAFMKRHKVMIDIGNNTLSFQR